MTHHPRRIPRSTVLVSLLWTILAAALAAWALATATPAAAVFCVAVPFLWITGLRAAALWMRAAAQVSRAAAQVSRAAAQVSRAVAQVAPAGGANRPADELRVALLYCVADDADPAAISASAAQDRAVDVVVLDDSRHPAVTRRLAEAAASHGWIVIRRRDRTGFKAGNLNHGLAALRGRYDA
ncbi:MAG: glycosyltransferase, partial [Microbacterium sp.]